MLIEPQTLYRDGLKCLLAGFADDFVVLGSGCVKDALRILTEEQCDMIILSSRCNMSDGLKEIACVTKQVQDTPLVLLPEFEDLDYFHQALTLGVKGIVTQRSSHEELLAALRLICAGGIYIPRELLYGGNVLAISDATGLRRNNSNMDENIDAEKLALLSDRQRQVLHYLIKGNANKSISRKLNISENTVKTHLSAIFKLLGVRNRTEAVYFANQADIQGDEGSTPPAASNF